MVRLAGAEPVIVPTTERNGWKMRASDFENAMTPRTKMLILNTPGNPTGSVYTREELEGDRRGRRGRRHLHPVRRNLREARLRRAEARQRRLAFAGSLRPHHHGKRIQQSLRDDRLAARYMAAPEAVAKAVDNIQSHSTSNPCSFAQKGAVAALKGDQQPLADMRDEFSMRRNYMYDRITKIPNITAVKPRRRLLHSGQHQPARTQLAEFCRSFVEQGERRGDPRRRFRRRSDRAPQLRDQHRHHQKRPRSVPGLLPDAVSDLRFQI